MTVRIADPLPECDLCGSPTRREAWEQNGHLCTSCSRGIADTVRMLPAAGGGVVDLERERARRRASDALAVADVGEETVYVERYIPPVPGQLLLTPEQEPACRWAHGPVAEIDDRGLCPICAEDEE